jgi:subtilisin family serine protease
MPHRLLSLVLLLTLAACSSTQPTAPPPAPAPAPSVPAEPPADDPLDTPPDPQPADAPNDWFLQSDETNGFPGADVRVTTQPRRSVVVAVIDGGTDIDHEDLQGRLWTNEDEIPGNGLDDDANGYADDIHGWNFIGGADGRNVNYDTYEVVRLYRELNARFEGIPEEEISADDEEAYGRYVQYRDEVAEKRAEFESQLPGVRQFDDIAQATLPALYDALGKQPGDEITAAELDRVADRPELGQAVAVAQLLQANGITAEELGEYREYLEGMLAYSLNPDFDERDIVGDDYSDPTERFYGNPDVAGPDAGHGTHVAGIIAARRDNGLGAMGVADSVKIMAVRAVPNGDERDKDVANAIRYAVDNGAQIINMSFGKAYSPGKTLVDEAVHYATERGVLLVHAAGNDAKDLESEPNFPNPRYESGGQSRLWIEVGASSWLGGEQLAADFSNYGRTRVDLFAPGVDIFSTLPGNDYGDQQGTSMAAPVVSGVAALVMSHFPNLTAVQVRDILLETARRYPQAVVLPGTEDDRVPFSTLSVTGGIVDAQAALARAAELSAN